MTQAPKAVAAMTDGEVQQFREQMYWAAYEEAALCEVALGAVDDPSGQAVTQGPWEPADCALLLASWHRAGLVSVHRPHGIGETAPPDLSHDEVAGLLGDPTRWRLTTASEHPLRLHVTPYGQLQSQEDWLLV